MCWKCKKTLNIQGLVTRADACQNCGTDVRCCKNCSWYSPGSHYDCRETIGEPVYEKERANFCDYFSLNVREGGDLLTGKKTGTDSKKTFNSLFGD